METKVKYHRNQIQELLSPWRLVLRQPAAVVPSAPGAVVGAADELPAALVVRVAVALPLQAEPGKFLGWRKSRHDVPH